MKLKPTAKKTSKAPTKNEKQVHCFKFLKKGYKLLKKIEGKGKTIQKKRRTKKKKKKVREMNLIRLIQETITTYYFNMIGIHSNNNRSSIQRIYQII